MPEPGDSSERGREDGGEAPMRRLVLRSAGRTEEFFDRLQAHYRECRRKEVDAEADLSVVLEDGTEFDSGTARVRDVSPTGALLTDVALSRGAYPTGPFTMDVRLRSGPYRGFGFRAEPVRFVPGQGGIGVRFEEVFMSAGRPGAARPTSPEAAAGDPGSGPDGPEDAEKRDSGPSD